MNRYAMGDIHGEYNKLIECLQLVNFDYKNDLLIQLGDIVDRGEHSFECVEELLKISNLIAIKGNHDACFYNGLISGDYLLYNQGCMETLRSYIKSCGSDERLVLNCKFRMIDIPLSHQLFFMNQRNYFIDENNNCFVHGGFNRHHLIEETDKYGDWSDLYWDRDLLHAARSYDSMKDKTYPFKNKNNFKEIFVGHTPVQYFENSNLPHKYANIWDLDTGCGKNDKYPLTIMNIETKEFWQSK